MGEAIGKKFTPPEMLRTRKEEGKAPQFFSFPSEGHPHRILMVFKQYDFKSLFGDGDSVGTARGLLEAPEDQFGRTVAATLKTTTSNLFSSKYFLTLSSFSSLLYRGVLRTSSKACDSCWILLSIFIVKNYIYNN